MLLSGCINTNIFALKSNSLNGEKVAAAVVQAAAPPQEATPTPAPQLSPTQPDPPEALAPLPPTGDGDALRFTFPTQGPPPKSAWRPPLYDVPWALTPYDHFYFRRPIAADEVNWPLADYRYGGIFPGTDNIVHTGIDIDAPMGTPVLAAAAGKVVWAGYGLFSGTSNPEAPYGLAVAIRHDFGYQGKRLYTVYAHMSQIDVTVNQRVDVGEQIGLVGDTGNTTGPHLHFEVRVEDNNFFSTRNPELWLAPPQGWGVLAGRIMNSDGSLISAMEVLVKSKENSNFWVVRTYGPTAIYSDDYYQENMALSDLPAGEYTVWLTYQEVVYKQDIRIDPGRISYFTFKGKDLFSLALPPAPEGNFTPQSP